MDKRWFLFRESNRLVLDQYELKLIAKKLGWRQRMNGEATPVGPPGTPGHSTPC